MNISTKVYSEICPLFIEGLKFNLYIADRKYYPGGAGFSDFPGWDIVGIKSGTILAFVVFSITSLAFEIPVITALFCLVVHLILACVVIPWFLANLQLYPDYDPGKNYNRADEGSIIRPFRKVR